MASKKQDPADQVDASLKNVDPPAKKEVTRAVKTVSVIDPHRADTLAKDIARGAGHPEHADAPGEGTPGAGQAAYPVNSVAVTPALVMDEYDPHQQL